jgi:hypothetical protein
MSDADAPTPDAADRFPGCVILHHIMLPGEEGRCGRLPPAPGRYRFLIEVGGCLAAYMREGGESWYVDPGCTTDDLMRAIGLMARAHMASIQSEEGLLSREVRRGL